MQAMLRFDGSGLSLSIVVLQGCQSMMNQQCLDCGLWQGTTHKRASYARGSDSPEIMIVGEAPGNQEDKDGVFFCGPAGKKIDEYIERAGLSKSQVRFENIVRCIPPNGKGGVRPPSDKEIDCCFQYLWSEINRLKPKLIIPVGNTALTAFTKYKAITRARGKLYEWKNPLNETSYEVLPTIHPAAVLRGNQKFEPMILADLSFAKEHISSNESSVSYLYLDNITYIDGVLSELELEVEAGRIPFIAVDLETYGSVSSLDPWDPNGKIICYSISGKANEAFCIPLGHINGPFANDPLAQAAVRNRVRDFLLKVPIAGHNFKFDYSWLVVRGGLPFGLNLVFDTHLASWILHSSTIPHDLEYLASLYANMFSHKQVLENAGISKKNMDVASPEILNQYASADADATFRISLALQKQLRDENMEGVFRELMLEMVEPFTAIENNGVQFDAAICKEAMKEYEDRFARLPQMLVDMGQFTIFQEAMVSNGFKKPEQFDYGKARHIATLLHDVWRLPVTQKTAKGAPATSKDVLADLGFMLKEWARTNPGWQPASEFLDHLRTCRKDAKIYSSYIKPLPGHQKDDGRLHTTYNIGCTASGRFSSTAPSFHTLPRKSEIKKAFISRFENGIVLDADYSQIELRVLAVYANDEAMLGAFREGKDIHRVVGSQLYNKPYDQVTSEERQQAKTVDFGLVYGRGAQAIADANNISIQAAEKIIEDFFIAFPKVRQFVDTQHAQIKKTGHCYSKFGRRRIVPEINGTKKEKGKAARISVNSPIQGTASEITGLSIKRIYHRMKAMNLRSKIFGFVHDSCIVDICPGELLQVCSVVYKEMFMMPQRLYPWLTLPLSVEFEIGMNWADKCEIIMHDDWNGFELIGNPGYVTSLQETLAKWDNPYNAIEKPVTVEDSDGITMHVQLKCRKPLY